MNSIRIVSLFMASLLLVACGSNPSKKHTDTSVTPDWIVNEPVSVGHVYGVGSAAVYVDDAKAIQQAQDAARVSMIQKLKVTVSGTFTQDTQEIRETGKHTQLVKTVRNQISSKIPQAEIDNLEIQENYIDRKSKTAYSLAHLDRRKAASKLRQRISDIDQQAIELSTSVSQQLPILNQLQSMVPALALLEKRTRLAEQLQLIDMNNRTEYKGADVKLVERRIQALFDALNVSLTAVNDASSDIRSGLTKSLTDLGLRIRQTSGDLNFFYKADLRSVEKNGRFVVFASGDVTIKDNDGRVLSGFNQDAKGVSAASMSQAKHKAIQALGKKLGNELAASFVSKID